MNRNIHRHHIIPRHIGGTDNPSNLIELSIMEHAEVHRKLWLEHGRWQDKLAWQGLVGMIDKEDIIHEILAEQGRLWATRRKNDYQKEPEYRAKISAKLMGHKQSPEQIAKRGEKTTGKKRTPEQKARMSAAMKGKKKSAEHIAKMKVNAQKQWKEKNWGDRAYGEIVI